MDKMSVQERAVWGYTRAIISLAEAIGLLTSQGRMTETAAQQTMAPHIRPEDE